MLIKYDYGDVAKAYILYRKKREDIGKTKEIGVSQEKIFDFVLGKGEEYKFK